MSLSSDLSGILFSIYNNNPANTRETIRGLESAIVRLCGIIAELDKRIAALELKDDDERTQPRS